MRELIDDLISRYPNRYSQDTDYYLKKYGGGIKKKIKKIDEIFNDVQDFGMFRDYYISVSLCSLSEIVIEIMPKIRYTYRYHFFCNKETGVLEIYNNLEDIWKFIKKEEGK